MFKSKNSKSAKLFKSQKQAKWEKMLLKNKNLLKFNAKKAGSNFLTPGTKTIFYYLYLIFIKILIIKFFDLEYYI